MKKSLIAAIVPAFASSGSSAAMAQDLGGNSPQALGLIDNTAFFGDTFEADNEASSFADRFTFTFTVSGDVGRHLDAIIGVLGFLARRHKARQA